jgi:hypothetical protein
MGQYCGGRYVLILKHDGGKHIVDKLNRKVKTAEHVFLCARISRYPTFFVVTAFLSSWEM